MRLHKKRQRSPDCFANSEKPKKMKAIRTRVSEHDAAITSLKIILQKVDENNCVSSSANVSRQQDGDTPSVVLSPINLNDNAFNSLKINLNDRKLLFERASESMSQVQYTSVDNKPLCDEYEGFETVTTSSVVSVRSKSVYVPRRKMVHEKTADGKLYNRPQNSAETVLRDVKNVVGTSVDTLPAEFINAKNILKSCPSGRENILANGRKVPRGRKPKTHLALVGCSSQKSSSSFCGESSNSEYKLVVRLDKLNENLNLSPYHRRIIDEETLEATSFTEHQCNYTKREIEQNVRIRKTVGIDLRSHETGFQKNCTEIVQQCYTETVRNIFVNDGGRNTRSEGITPVTGMMTRKRAAALAISKNKENLKKCVDVTVKLKPIESSSLCRSTPKIVLVPYGCTDSTKGNNETKKNLNVSFRSPKDEEEYSPDRTTQSKFVPKRIDISCSNTPCFEKDEKSKQAGRCFRETRRSKLSRTGVKLERDLMGNLKVNTLANEEDSKLCPASMSCTKTSSMKKGKKSKKNLNVSFKTQDDQEEDLYEMSLSQRLRKNRRYPLRKYQTSDASSETETCSSSVLISRNTKNNGGFRGFDNSNDYNSDSLGFCSYILESFDGSDRKLRNKKRMTRAEAASRTELVNACKKTVERNSGMARKSYRLALKRIKKDLSMSSTPLVDKKSPLVKKENPSTPFLILNKLNEADISSYKITPLREDKWPLPPKTEDDYGIDDVNTDDSTDDEELPKKCLPKWVLQVKMNLAAHYNPQSFVPADQVHLWMKPPKFRYSLKKFLFK